MCASCGTKFTDVQAVLEHQERIQLPTHGHSESRPGTWEVRTADGVSAKSEGINRVIRLVARAAHGFRNPANQRLRTRCVTTRRARGHLHPA